jgi:hypothetical protein
MTFTFIDIETEKKYAMKYFAKKASKSIEIDSESYNRELKVLNIIEKNNLDDFIM